MSDTMKMCHKQMNNRINNRHLLVHKFFLNYPLKTSLTTPQRTNKIACSIFSTILIRNKIVQYFIAQPKRKHKERRD